MSADLAALRADLLDLSWVSDARVSRQLPDTLVVDIVERQPHAVLRQPDRLVLIDDEDGIRAATVAHWLSRRNFEIAILRHAFAHAGAGAETTAQA